MIKPKHTGKIVQNDVSREFEAKLTWMKPELDPSLALIIHFLIDFSFYWPLFCT